MIRLKNLEIHVVHNCNLACESCSHYSNQGHGGVLALDDADRWMKLWNQRVEPAIFSLLGGEPTLHPDLPELIVIARRNWPRSSLRIVTNGFFLTRHPRLPLVLKADPDATLNVSVHHRDPEYRERLAPNLALLDEWIRDHGIKTQVIKSHSRWTRRYHGTGAAMEPYADAKPRESWENCAARYCPQLFAGKIWKCAPLTYLRMQHEKYGLSERWKPYLDYRPIAPESTDAEVAEFFAREEESYCSMCPAQPERFKLPNPLKSARAATS